MVNFIHHPQDITDIHVYGAGDCRIEEPILSNRFIGRVEVKAHQFPLPLKTGEPELPPVVSTLDKKLTGTELNSSGLSKQENRRQIQPRGS